MSPPALETPPTLTRIRPPWVSSTTGEASWSALLFHVAGAIILVRLAVGAGVGAWMPGELDGVNAAAILAALGGIYRWRPVGVDR